MKQETTPIDSGYPKMFGEYRLKLVTDLLGKRFEACRVLHDLPCIQCTLS
jgi:hypothetical protein